MNSKNNLKHFCTAAENGCLEEAEKWSAQFSGKGSADAFNVDANSLGSIMETDDINSYSKPSQMLQIQNNRLRTKGQGQKELWKKVQKEAKYSTLETLTMKMLKQKKLYAVSKKLASTNLIPLHKNYCIIALRIGLLLHHLMSSQCRSKSESIAELFGKLTEGVQTCVWKKYKNHPQAEELCTLVLEKNLTDLEVFRKGMSSSLADFNETYRIFEGLYQTNLDGEPLYKINRFCQKVVLTAMGACRDGSGLDLNAQYRKFVKMARGKNQNQFSQTGQSQPISALRKAPRNSSTNFCEAESFGEENLEDLISHEMINSFRVDCKVEVSYQNYLEIMEF